jgi:hypothetical protein
MKRSRNAIERVPQQVPIRSLEVNETRLRGLAA